MSRRRRPPPTVEQRLQAAYAAVPDVACIGLCQEACGPVVGLTELERNHIARQHQVVLPLSMFHPDALASPLGVRNTQCPALDSKGDCSVYADRPTICRLWGAVEAMACEFGCRPAGGWMSDRAARVTLDRVKALSDQARTDPPGSTAND